MKYKNSVQFVLLYLISRCNIDRNKNNEQAKIYKNTLIMSLADHHLELCDILPLNVFYTLFGHSITLLPVD